MLRWMPILFVGAVVTFLVNMCYVALPHEAPKGWSYPTRCCSGIDCREVAPKAIREVKTGWVIVATSEILKFGDPRIKDSPDGAFHWCSYMGKEDTKTICLFVPPQGS